MLTTLLKLTQAFLGVCTGGRLANGSTVGHAAQGQHLPAVMRASSVDRNPARSTVGLVTTWQTKRRLSSRAWAQAAESALRAGMLRSQAEAIVDHHADPMHACGGPST